MLKHRITCVPPCALGHTLSAKCECLSLWAFLSRLAFGWWNCCSCVLTWPVPSHQASVIETVSVARSHLSLTHKFPFTHMCHIHIQITSGLPTTSCLFVSYTHTHALCPTQVSITVLEKVKRTNRPQTDSLCLTPQTDLKMDTQMHTYTHLLYKHRIKVISHVSACLSNPKIVSVIRESGICTQTSRICLHSITHVWALFFFWYDTWLSCEYCSIEAVSTLQLIADKSTFYLLAACCSKSFSSF